MRSLLRWPIFSLFCTRVRASAIAMTAHAIFMTFLLEPALRWLMPPAPRPTGLAAIFAGNPPPPRHLEVLAWLDPVLWILSWAAFCVFLERSIKPALARAREKSRSLEAEAKQKLGRGEVLAGMTLLAEAQAVSPDEADQQRLQATLAEVRSTHLAGAPPAAATLARLRSQEETPAATRPVAAEPRAPVVGSRITLDVELGAGAMGRVYAATDHLLGRRLAVKELADGIAANAAHRERFLQEARALARLSHPNIVQIFDLLGEADHHYLCMELVEGASLEAELQRRSALPIHEAAGIGRQIAAALAYAHGKGVIHRDLKPANVLLTPEGTAKVVDFGVARLVDQRVTRTGAMMGTPIYMAPEQIQGGDVDARSDLYALGVVLYELAAGQPPFDGTLTQVFSGHLTREPPPLELPDDPAARSYAALVMGLLAKEKEGRPASAAAVVEALLPLEQAPAATGAWQPVSA